VWRALARGLNDGEEPVFKEVVAKVNEQYALIRP
jgi:hypothetical protein